MSFEVYGDFDRFTATSDNGIKGTYHEHKPCGFMLNVINSIENTCRQQTADANGIFMLKPSEHRQRL